MGGASYEILSDTGEYYGEIPGFQGVWASAPSLDECRQELGEVLEDWVVLRLVQRLALPTAGGIELVIPHVA